MIRYIPFLKAKRGELTAMSELAPKVKQTICPFFDFPRKKANYDSETYAGIAQSIATSLKKHWGNGAEFYFDDLDIDQKLTVKGENQYAYMLKALKELQVIPVVALDRTKHNAAVAQLKRDGEIGSATVAFRADKSDFEDFDGNADQIDYDLASAFKQFEVIDLILDCRLCTGTDVLETSRQIATFAKKFCNAYDKVRRVIVTGSSLPASIGEVLSVDSTAVVARRELAILSKARDLSDVELIAGDYTTVSPFYSDADLDPKIMQNVMTPRLIYPFRQSYYITRGVSMKSGGYGQYVGLALGLCGQDFFRPGYSTGEDYFYEKSRRIGKNATNGTVVKPSVVAHITYMVLGAKL
ncbi:MAG TPA: hypothetical protein VJA21_15590 [Verrucomicrobiae bacterium]